MEPNQNLNPNAAAQPLPEQPAQPVAPSANAEQVIDQLTVEQQMAAALSEPVQPVAPAAPIANDPANIPAQPEATLTAPEPQPAVAAAAMPQPQKKSNLAMILGMVLCAVIAIGGVAFGIIMMNNKNTSDANYAQQISALKKTNAELLEEVSAAAEEEDVDAADYIYIGQWGLKIAIPSNLNNVSYQYIINNRVNDEFLEVYGTKTGFGDYLPEFANGFINSTWQGSVARYPLGTDPQVNVNGTLGTPIFSDDDYGYYYIHPQAAYSTDETELNWEVESANLIQEMLTNPDNYSAI